MDLAVFVDPKSGMRYRVEHAFVNIGILLGRCCCGDETYANVVIAIGLVISILQTLPQLELGDRPDYGANVAQPKIETYRLIQFSGKSLIALSGPASNLNANAETCNPLSKPY